jgi:hypothetical protein
MPDGSGKTVSLESALKLLGYSEGAGTQSAGVANIKTLASAIKRKGMAQLDLARKEDLLDRIDNAVKEYETTRLEEKFPQDLFAEYKEATGGYTLDPDRWKDIRHNLADSNARIQRKINDLDKHIAILAEKAADSGEGSGPEKHRAALRHCDELFNRLRTDNRGGQWQTPAEALRVWFQSKGMNTNQQMDEPFKELRPLLKRFYVMTGRDLVGRNTAKTLQPDETPERTILGRKAPAIPASTDRKITKWYLENKGEIKEEGNHEELSAKEGGIYAKMLRTQNEMQSIIAIAG